MSDDEEAGYPRFALSGRSFVYLLPCRDEDILKFGFSRDPLQRMRALHRRFFDFFDLDRALLIEVEKLSDARRIERAAMARFARCRAPVPLVVRDAAAGKTEWFRGAAAPGDAFMREIAAEEGWILHDPLASWLRQRFDERGDVVYDWSMHMLDAIEYQHFNLPPEMREMRAERALRGFLDACESVHMDIGDLVPARVFAWYRDGGFR